MSSKELVVKGIGKATAAPDLIVLTINLEASELDYEATMRRGEEKLDALRAAIVSAGHDERELKTSTFKVDTKYENYPEENIWKQRFIGYVCAHSLKLEFDLNMPTLGATLGAIAQCGADPNFNIRFSLKDPDTISEQLLESTIKNATQKAIILAKSAGVTLGAIQRIDCNWGDIRPFSNTDMSMDNNVLRVASAAPLAIDIEPEEISVRDNVTVVWAIE